MFIYLFNLFLYLWFTEGYSVAATKGTAILRGENPFHQMKLSPKGRFVAYTGDDGIGLNVLDLKSNDIYRVSQEKVGASFFWTPDGYRIFFRELVRSPLKKPRSDNEKAQEETLWATKIRSVIKAFDCSVARTLDIDMIPRSSGLLTFDPRDYRFLLMSESGIHTKKIEFPGQRLGQWQISRRSERGKWLATQKGILRVTEGGLIIRRLEDDGKELSSFDISPDGQWITWSTEGSRVYVSNDGKTPQFIGFGRDPKWHPTLHLIVFAGARMVGDKPVNYDLKVADVKGQQRYLTATQFSSERSPHWDLEGRKIIYTVEQTTDLYVLDLQKSQDPELGS